MNWRNRVILLDRWIGISFLSSSVIQLLDRLLKSALEVVESLTRELTIVNRKFYKAFSTKAVVLAAV
jgi:hypothetical protein